MGSQNEIMELTNHQKAIIIGTLLGDATLERNGKNPRLRIGHSLKQKEYIWWKYNELKTLTTSKPKIATSYHKKVKKYYKWLCFSSLSSEVFTFYQRMFYPNGRKEVTSLLCRSFKSPLSLAVWYMDDGYKRSDCNALRISTDAFSLPEQKLLQDMLRKNFSINVNLHKKGKWWNLYIPHKETNKFIDIVAPYIIPDMKYKIVLSP